MEVIDITVGLSGMTITYPGDPKVSITRDKTFQRDNVRVSKLTLGCHSGTHVDAPAHFLKDGESIDEIGLKPLIGKALVCGLTKVKDSISAADLEKFKISKGEILLLKTRNSRLLKKSVFVKDFVSLSTEAAEYLVNREIKCVGIDYLSIEGYGEKGNNVHKSLLSRGVPIIEGLDLGEVRPGRYMLYCLPLKLVGCEAAPARCILVKA